MAQLVRQARFKLRASIQDIDYQHPRNLKKAQVAQLAQTDWLERGQNLLITGPGGIDTLLADVDRRAFLAADPFG